MGWRRGRDLEEVLLEQVALAAGEEHGQAWTRNMLIDLV